VPHAEKSNGSLFDWSFEADGPAATGGMDYRNIKVSGADAPMGRVFGTGGQVPNHAVFYILVANVEATCADAQQLGGSVVQQAPHRRPSLRPRDRARDDDGIPVRTPRRQVPASYDDKAGALVLKLPRERVTQIVETQAGDSFAPAGKVFREWVATTTVDRDLWGPERPASPRPGDPEGVEGLPPPVRPAA
jgi:hypothetical protein